MIAEVRDMLKWRTVRASEVRVGDTVRSGVDKGWYVESRELCGAYSRNHVHLNNDCYHVDTVIQIARG